MSGQKKAAQARAAQVAAMRAEQKRRERRFRMITTSIVVLVVGGLVTAVVLVLVGEDRRRRALEDAAAQPIEGVVEFTDLSREHTPQPEPTAEPGGTILPPAGGDHDPVWLNCGVYSEPVLSRHAIHSLEHGAVWVTYQSDLPQDQVNLLVSAVEGKAFTILSPFEDLASPVVLTAWGNQLELDSADDPRIDVFLQKFIQGAQTPEPGAPCSGGTGNPG